jgi:molybdopterin converting factor small subunit
MGLFDRLRALFGGADVSATIRVHVLIKGRIGEGWQDVDRSLRLAQGSTLADLITAADAAGIPLSHALAHSPHLRHTLMLNGERCPVSEADRRTLADGDQVYLLAPLAGG